ncbi:5-(carboxyamino)imidazole ribonucleotide synthase [Nanchangia anserum]|uniref:N5-carboxyaminoimidazole ribonucleotide synthase n=1 Tax=Nanchangia anserum TaxID=2692125 RepID=A0A8I0GHJ0_9ACTO|nr:5-(carboxyamino)imidazole ribonucleotide synthase [Nanchangia anserum]MBD3690094.1 5-(carboxyamino)imidazole ribonucleotide synthase [Nanchangia anserum]QOX82118.1 5-(carboxyamino)imidazole ribonucleotide synthase [Nanchangia anserum]
MSAPIVAVVGGGQLARMMQESANALGIHLRALVEAADGSSAQVIPDHRVGHPDDDTAMDELVAGADVLTFEHEHIPDAQLARLASRLPIEPKAGALHFAQDKIAMRQRLSAAGIACPEWTTCRTREELTEIGQRWGWPVVVKWARGGYDGHGVAVVTDPADIASWFDDLAEGDALLVEEHVPFTREVAALLARSRSGECVAWPLTQTIQRDGICHVAMAPAPGLDPALAREATDIGYRVAAELDVTGVLAVEMFVVEGDSPRVVVNELAMRPHNSGHWTIEGSLTSQFENHLRAVLDLPLGDTRMVAPAACMVNVLGSARAEPRDAYAAVMAREPGAKIHYYGKGVRPGRKLGHVTMIGDDIADIRRRAEACARAIEADEKGN